MHGVAGGTKKFNRVGTFEFKAVYQGSSKYGKSTSNLVDLVSK